MCPELPELGVGVTYISGLHEFIQSTPDLVDVVEVEPQTFWFADGVASDGYHIDEAAFKRVLDLPQKKLVHGIGFPVGGTLPPAQAQLGPLRRMIRLLKPPWISEHLSFNLFRQNGDVRCAGFLLPPRQNHAGVKAAVASIQRFMSDTGCHVAVETGVSYLKPRDDELEDGEFVAEVVKEAGCGILLDLHNLYTNQRNGRQTVTDFLQQLPLNRVWEIHLAGGSERRGYWLDSHSGATPDDLFDLARDVVSCLPNLKALIFELFPAYLPQVGASRVGSELERIRAIWDSRHRNATQTPSRASKAPRSVSSEGPCPEEWEDTLGALVIGHPAEGGLAEALSADPGVQLTRELLGEFRASMIVSTLRLSSRLLLLTLGEDRFWELLERYWLTSAPHVFASVEAEGFADFLLDRGVSVAFLSDVLAFERATVRVLVTGRRELVQFTHDPSQVLLELARGRLPSDARPGAYEIDLTPRSVRDDVGSRLHAQMVFH